jgi:triacylglycerol lipase
MQKLHHSLVALASFFYYLVLGWLYAAYYEFSSIGHSSCPEDYTNPQSKKPPIVLIPGVYEHWRFMRPLLGCLQDAGYHVHVITSLGFNSGEIPAMAQLVAEYIMQHKLQNIVIVAHSKGGLIGKCVLAHNNMQSRVHGMVSINSLYSGSIYAYLAPVKAVRMFSTRSLIISQLEANKIVKQSVYSLYSRYDPNIPCGSKLTGATNISIDSVGHFRLLSTKQLQTTLLQSVNILTSQAIRSAVKQSTN